MAEMRNVLIHSLLVTKQIVMAMFTCLHVFTCYEFVTNTFSLAYKCMIMHSDSSEGESAWDFEAILNAKGQVLTYFPGPLQRSPWCLG